MSGEFTGPDCGVDGCERERGHIGFHVDPYKEATRMGEWKLQRVGPREADILPPGWRIVRDEDGVVWIVSPTGRAYDRLPAGYEPADVALLDELLTDLFPPPEAPEVAP